MPKPLMPKPFMPRTPRTSPRPSTATPPSPSIHSIDGAEVLYVDTFQLNADGIRELEFDDSNYVDQFNFPDLYLDDSGGGQTAFYGPAIISSAHSDFIPGSTPCRTFTATPSVTVDILIAGVTPEPSSLILLGTGMLSLAGAAHRRRAA